MNVKYMYINRHNHYLHVYATCFFPVRFLRLTHSPTLQDCWHRQIRRLPTCWSIWAGRKWCRGQDLGCIRWTSWWRGRAKAVRAAARAPVMDLEIARWRAAVWKIWKESDWFVARFFWHWGINMDLLTSIVHWYTLIILAQGSWLSSHSQGRSSLHW